MKKYWFIVIAALVLFSSTSVLAAKPDSLPAAAAGKTLSLPPQATEVAPGLYYLGKAFDKGKLVEGYAFVHYKPGYAKPANPGKPAKDISYYTYLAKGARWRTVEPYLVDSDNDEGLSSDFVRGIIATSIGKWETAAGKDILGTETSGTVDGPDDVSPDGKNEVMFGTIDGEGAIAVTIVWGSFSAPVPFRELTEWDQVYDEEDYAWSSSGEAGKMDFENIATHELGHSVGMGDLYNTACSEQTMYGYAALGETKKRTLESGDILGVKSLYA